MAAIKTFSSGSKAKMAELLSKKPAARSSELSELMRSPAGERKAAQYTCMADDAAMSEPKREASMLLSAATTALEVTDTKECLKVAGDALEKFKALGDSGKVGVVDSIHLMIDAHRMQAYMTYSYPEEGLKLAKEELGKFKEAGDKFGTATMQLAIAEIGTDDVRLNKRKEALEPVTEALTIAKEIENKKLEAKCLLESAMVHYSTNEADKMLEEAEAALKIAEDNKDNMTKAKALYAISLASVKNKSWETAVQKATLAQKVFEEMGKKAYEAGALHTMAMWRLVDEKPKKAVPLAEQALAVAKSLEKGTRAEAVTAFTACEALIEAKNAKGALKVAKDALDKFSADANAKSEQAMMQEALTAVHLASDSPEKAVKTIDLAVKLAEEMGDKRYEARLLIEAAAVHVKNKDKDEASDALEKAIETAADASDYQTQAYAQREMCVFYMFEKGDYKEAQKMAGQAAETAQQDDDKVGEGEATLRLAFAHSFLEENSKALSACNDAQELFQEAGYLEGEANALWMTAELKAFDGKFEAALEAAEERLSICIEMKDLKLQAKTHILLGSLHSRDKNWEEAEKMCKEAQGLAAKLDDAELETEVQLLLVQIFMDQAQDAGDKNAKTLYGKASKMAEDALKSATKSGEKAPKAMALYCKAQTLVMEDKLQDAQRSVSEAENLYKNVSEQGQAACLHLLGTLQLAFGSVDKALDTLDRALALSQSCKDIDLEYEISSSIYNVQRQIQPQQQMMVMDPAMMQQMMPAQGGDAGAVVDAGAAAQSVAAKPKGLDPAFVRKQLMTFVKDVMATDDELELDSPFMEAGMDSLSSVSLMSMVAKEFQMALSPSLVFDFPTVRALEDHLVEESKNM